jgi:hypothetical protein
MRQSNLDRWSSQTPGNDDRMPEERSEKATTIMRRMRGQAVGIAHAKLLGRPPANQPHQTLIKIS